MWGLSCELSSTAALFKVSGLTGSSPSRMETPKQYSGAQIQPLGSHTWERWAGSRLSGQPARKKWHRPCRAGGPTCPTCPHHWIPAAAAAGWPCPPAAGSGPAPHGPAGSGQRGGARLQMSNLPGCRCTLYAQAGPGVGAVSPPLDHTSCWPAHLPSNAPADVCEPTCCMMWRASSFSASAPAFTRAHTRASCGMQAGQHRCSVGRPTEQSGPGMTPAAAVLS